MRRPVFVLALLAVLLAPAVVLPRTAAACSLDPSFDPIAEMEIAFAGRVTDLRVAEELWDGINAFVPVWVDFEVDRYLKGDGPAIFSALDRVSVIFDGSQDAARENDFSEAQFAGAAGACGALLEDPRGQYWVTAAEHRDGRYELSMGFVLARGDGPDHPEVVDALAGPGVMPATTGHGLAPTTDRGVPAALGALALAMLGAAWLATGKRQRTRPGAS